MRNLLFLREYGVFLFTLLSASGCHSGKSALNSSTNADDSSACPSGKAIVSLTYDDGLPSQIANALPALDASDFRGTFFLNDISANPAPWKDAKKAGHELGSHTVHHPCTETFDWVQKENASEAYTEQRMADELRAQVELLRSLGQKSPLSFAYPCGTTWIGEAHKSYVPLIRMRFAAARGVEGQIYTHIEDPMNIGAYFIEGPKETLIERAQEAITTKGWAVFGFHGVGGDYLPISKEDHKVFLEWLDANRNTVRVMPFGQAARCMPRISHPTR